MSSLDATFKELLDRVREPDALNPAKSDPIYYFVYPPEMMLEIKKHLRPWITKLREAQFQVERISLPEILWQLIDKSGRWDGWVEIEKDAELDQVNEAIRDVLRSADVFTEAVATRIAAVPEGTIVLLTEAELLHPYFRTRTIESRLHDRVKTPTIIFYPGRRSGQYGLHFLDFYPVDGNYRSTLLGGF